MGAPVTIRNAALAWRDGRITYAGTASGLPPSERPSPIIQATGAVVPGFVDCHTHLPFFGWRADEFEARLSGQTYRDVQGGGGGISGVLASWPAQATTRCSSSAFPSPPRCSPTGRRRSS